MSQVTERTRLLPDESRPQYVFDSSIARERKRRVRQFQCCLCVIFICIIFIALLVTVAFSIQSSEDENNNNTTNSTEFNSLLVLLSNSWPRDDKKFDKIEIDNGTRLFQALEAGEEALAEKDLFESNNTALLVNKPSFRHQKLVATSEKAQLLSRIGYKEEFAARNLSIKNDGTVRCYNKFTGLCHKTAVQCNKLHRYRSYNGTCNNLKHPTDFGVAYTPFRRALPPDYADGIGSPRVGINGTSLPSARTVSLVVHPPNNRNNDKFSVMLAVWGQFLDHDITATALSQGPKGAPISCCSTQEPIHPECFPVELDESDPYASYNNMTCMEFVRSSPAPSCCFGPRDQLNQVTAFIDGSVVYGADEDLASRLRTGKNGQLDMYLTEDNRTLLPVSTDLNDGCNRFKENKNGKYCFLAGDGRANENLHLTSIHLIWARHHNFLAKQLKVRNPKWGDERLFQEARKILGAQMQHITYREFLPILLGPDLMSKFDLNPQLSGYFLKYNDSMDPSIANNFATAAFRFAHSIIPSLMKFLANDTSSPEFVQLHRMLLDPYKLYRPGELDRALRGAMNTTIAANDPYFSDELKNHLFEDDSDGGGIQCGLDLVSLNIQRGRDHGLVGYNSWREYCRLRKAPTFEYLQRDMDNDSLENIKSIYRNVEDIDLYTGALSEKPIQGSILGPTITCLILDQFVRLKFGDRFWYENPHVFTVAQLEEIRKTSLARIICDNSDDVRITQPLVMERVKVGNELKRCSELPAPNLDVWKQEVTRVLTPTDQVSVRSRAVVQLLG